MRREFTAISAFSAAIAFVAGVVLCLQVANAKAAAGGQISGPTLWGVELAIFGTAVYLWRSGVSLAGWLLGVGALVVLRLALSTCAGFSLGAMHANEPPHLAIYRMSALAPRMCAVLFALMVCYPLRGFLPLRSERPGRRRRFADGAGAKSGVSGPADGDAQLVIWAGSERKGNSERKGGYVVGSMLDTSRLRMEVEGTIELPVSAVLALVPRELVEETALDTGESRMMSVPLAAIVPQLREARIQVTPAQIRSWLPAAARKAVVERADGGEGTESAVVLPLELVVPRLPPGTLELPPASPPAWANVGEAQRVVFARL